MIFSKCNMKLLLIFFIPLFLYGCPYESAIPLSKFTDTKIDKDLIGKWIPAEEKDKDPGFMLITQFNDHELLFLLTEKGKDEIEAWRGYATIIGKEKFLNLQRIKSPYVKRHWSLVSYTVEKDVYTMKIFEEKIFKNKKFGSSKELYEFVKKNLKNKDLYDDDKFVLKRVK